MGSIVTERSTKRDNGKGAELIRIGVRIFTQQGFSNTSLDDLVAIAGVPKGSFYYYFKNKNAYVAAVIESYGEYFCRKLDRLLADTSRSAIDRIQAFTDDATAGMERYAFKRGCLVGNLGQELASLNDDLRLALLKVLMEWRSRIRIVLDEAIAQGEIRSDVDTASLARYFWTAWEGAVLCAKLERSREPLDEASRAFTAHLIHLRA